MNDTPKTPAIRGWRTLFQVLAGTFVGLVLAVWNVPGVPEAITSYARENFVPLFFQLGAMIGVPAAIISWGQNKLGK